jgi:hypothetical protein
MMGAMGDLAGFGFWMFIAAVVVSGMWFDSKKREGQQETLRRLVDSGKNIDSSVMEKMLAASDGDKRMDGELRTAGIIVLFVSPGLYVLGYFMNSINEKLLPIMTGVAALVAFVGVGLLVAAKVAGNQYDDRD